MPLIILGLIVVLGAALLIYYQLGPKVTLRLRGNRDSSGGGPGGGAPDTSTEADGDANADPAQESAKSKTPEDEKVLYVFGDGEREERPLREEGDSDDQSK